MEIKHVGTEQALRMRQIKRTSLPNKFNCV